MGHVPGEIYTVDYIVSDDLCHDFDMCNCNVNYHRTCFLASLTSPVRCFRWEEVSYELVAVVAGELFGLLSWRTLRYSDANAAGGASLLRIDFIAIELSINYANNSAHAVVSFADNTESNLDKVV